jgi:hypothetical protein
VLANPIPLALLIGLVVVNVIAVCRIPAAEVGTWSLRLTQLILSLNEGIGLLGWLFAFIFATGLFPSDPRRRK